MIPGIVAGRAVTVAGWNPDWANVALALHFDGADESTTFTDETGRSWTPAGGAQIDTEYSVFGGASGLFDGDGDYISSPAPAGLSLGTGDFSLRCWIRLSDTGERTILSQWSTTSATNRGLVITASTEAITVYWSTNGTTLAGSVTRSVSLSTGVWYHLAVCRASGSVRIFIDGLIVGSSASMGGVFNSTRDIFIGRQDGSSAYDFAGHIDDLQLVVGEAGYTGNFTPPTGPFPSP